MLGVSVLKVTGGVVTVGRQISRHLETTTTICFSLFNQKFTHRNEINYQQKAFYRKNFSFPRTWVDRRGGGYDENLSAENQSFLDKVVLDRYAENSPLKEAPWKRGQFNNDSVNKRIGLIAVKLGSIPQWTNDGKKVYLTMLQVLDNHVIDYVPPEVIMSKSNNSVLKSRTKEGRLGMAIVGALSSDPRLYTSSYLKLFENSGVPPKRKLTKFMITPNAAVQPGTPLFASHFRVGDYVDVGAKTIGYGFQGVMKRWGFKGGPRSHGATKFHRKRGTIGSGRDRKPIKGMKMAGHMGCKWRIQFGLKVWRINNKYNILYVQGPVIPGPTHCYVRVVDSGLPHSREKLRNNPPPFPTLYIDEKKKLAEEIFDPQLFQFNSPTLKFENVEIKKQVKREGAKLAKIKN